jgi:hypothetical protein
MFLIIIECSHRVIFEALESPRPAVGVFRVLPQGLSFAPHEVVAAPIGQVRRHWNVIEHRPESLHRGHFVDLLETGLVLGGRRSPNHPDVDKNHTIKITAQLLSDEISHLSK